MRGLVAFDGLGVGCGWRESPRRACGALRLMEGLGCCPAPRGQLDGPAWPPGRANRADMDHCGCRTRRDVVANCDASGCTDDRSRIAALSQADVGARWELQQRGTGVAHLVNEYWSKVPTRGAGGGETGRGGHNSRWRLAR